MCHVSCWRRVFRIGSSWRCSCTRRSVLSVVVRPKCGHGSWATTPARSPLDRQVRLDVGLSAWELACHTLPTTVFAAQRLFALPVSARQVPVFTPRSGTQLARCFSSSYSSSSPAPVVSIPGSRLRRQWPLVDLPARISSRSDAWSASGPHMLTIHEDESVDCSESFTPFCR